MRLIDVKREQMIDGMDAIIRRVCRLGPRGDFVLMYDEMSPRELAIKLLSFVEGRDPEFVNCDPKAGASDAEAKTKPAA